MPERLPDILQPTFNLLADDRDAIEDIVELFFDVLVERLAAYLVEILGEGPHRNVDRHTVVVEDDEEVLLQDAGVIQRLEGHACGDGGVSHYCDGLRIPLEELVCSCEPRCQ